MAFDSEKIKQLAAQLTGTLVAVGTLVTTIAGGAAWLKAHLLWVFIPGVAGALSWAIPLGGSLALALLAWRSASKRSRLKRPQAFDLRALTRNQLKGRDQDISDLKSLVSESRLVFLVGESGSGKSALLTAGFVPELQAEHRFVPLLIQRYGTDWDYGPLRETTLALWEALSETDRAAIDLTSRPDPQSVDSSYLSSKLRQLCERTGRVPMLIFDQFDDYQARYRRKFITRRGAWITVRQLEAANSFWRLIGEALRSDDMRCVIATRNDTAAGLISAKFVNEAVVRNLSRLQAVFVASLLDDLAPTNANPPIVTDPEAGWIQLMDVLVRDLQQDGFVLPQQVRIVLLGLRSLSALTPKEYRRAGKIQGVEAKFIQSAITSVSKSCGVSASHLRKVLLAMTEPAVGEREDKTRRCSELDFDRIVPSLERTSRVEVLKTLTQQKVVRQVVNAEVGIVEWQLDHDYLARAVLQTERAYERHATKLKVAAAVWQGAKGAPLKRWKLLLSFSTQIRFLFARLRPGSTFRYGADRYFAFASLARIAPATLIVLSVGAIIAVFETVFMIENIVIGLQSSLPEPRTQAALVLWSQSDFRRSAIARALLREPSLLSNVEVSWITAAAGLDVALTSEFNDQLRTLLDSKGSDGATASLIRHLGLNASRLDTEKALEVARILRERLARGEASPEVRDALVFGLSYVALRVNEVELKEIVAGLHERLVANDAASYEWGSALDAYVRLAPRLDGPSLNEFARALRTRMSTEKNPALKMVMAMTLRKIAAQLDQADPYSFTIGLADQIAKEVDESVRLELISALEETIAKIPDTRAVYFMELFRRRLTSAQEVADRVVTITALGRFAESESIALKFVASLANELRERLAKETAEAARVALLAANARAASRLGRDEATRLTFEILKQFGLQEGRIERIDLLGALRALSKTLGDHAGADLADRLLRSLIKERDADVSVGIADTLVQFTSHLTSEAALHAMTELRADLRARPHNFLDSIALYRVMVACAARLDDQSVNRLLGEWRQHVTKERDGATVDSLYFGLGALASRLDAKAAENLAQDIWDRAFRSSFVIVIGEVVPRMRDQQAVEWTARAALLLKDAENEVQRLLAYRALQNSCDRLVRSSSSEREGVECLLLVLSYPVEELLDSAPSSALYPWPRDDAWRTLQRLSGQKFNGDIVLAANWARVKYGIKPASVKPHGFLSHYENSGR